MELGRVDLRGLEPGWDEARAAVAASMLAHGCVVVVAGGPAPALRDALFGRVLPELFALTPGTSPAACLSPCASTTPKTPAMFAPSPTSSGPTAAILPSGNC
ncbi:hypothetical protein EJB05_49226, partial [Eragrostis curvula]